MQTYTVLLVDDEEEVIQIILKKIDWESLGFSVIGYANNGVKALEMVEEFQPDVVMTDIKMPYMDGIELAGRIRENFPVTKILLFTGFDEFEYAKAAVHLEIEEYILKPVNAAELTGVFTQLKKKLDQEISEKRNIEILQKYYMESLPVQRSNFYTTLIEGRLREEELEGYLSNYQISLSGPFFVCLVIHTSSSRTPADMTPILLDAAVKKHAEERMEERWRARFFSYLGNTVAIAQLRSEHEINELTDECDRLCTYSRRIIQAVTTIGIGRVYGSLIKMSQSYTGAREAVSYRVIYGSSRAINIREVAPREMGRWIASYEMELANLFKQIRIGNEAEIREAARKYLEQITLSAKSLRQYHIAVMELISEIYRFTVNNDIVAKLFEGDIRSLCGSLLDMEPEGLERWLVDVSLSFGEQLITARKTSTRSIVMRAQEYVRNNFSDEQVSLDVICKELGVSNSYFSSVFKRETGKSFIGYLTDYRMNQASRLLLETSEKSYRIAQKVGYVDANYFSYVFKRTFGVSPSKYRAEHTEGES